MIPKAQAAKAKIDKGDFIILKSFYIAKEPIKRVKKQIYVMGFANHIPDKGLICKICKELK